MRERDNLYVSVCCANLDEKGWVGYMEKSVHKEYIANLIDSMIHNMDEQSSNVMLIEHYNTLDL